MKKINFLFPVGLLSIAISTSFAYADSARFVDTIYGDALAIASVQVNAENGVYRDGKDVAVEKISSNGTVTKERENGISNENEKEDATSTKSEKDDENDLLNSTSTINFEINGDKERSKENRGSVISDVAQVHNGNDLNLFVQSLVNKNKDIESVSSKEDRVSVARNVKTKLFGFIPSSIKETVLVISWSDGTEQVVVSRPWWNFLSKDNVSTTTITSADIETRIKNISTGELKSVLDAKTKAHIILEIQNAFINSTTSSTVSS